MLTANCGEKKSKMVCGAFGKTCAWEGEECVDRPREEVARGRGGEYRAADDAAMDCRPLYGEGFRDPKYGYVCYEREEEDDAAAADPNVVVLDLEAPARSPFADHNGIKVDLLDTATGIATRVSVGGLFHFWASDNNKAVTWMKPEVVAGQDPEDVFPLPVTSPVMLKHPYTGGYIISTVRPVLANLAETLAEQPSGAITEAQVTVPITPAGKKLLGNIEGTFGVSEIHGTAIDTYDIPAKFARGIDCGRNREVVFDNVDNVSDTEAELSIHTMNIPRLHDEDAWFKVAGPYHATDSIIEFTRLMCSAIPGDGKVVIFTGSDGFDADLRDQFPEDAQQLMLSYNIVPLIRRYKTQRELEDEERQRIQQHQAELRMAETQARIRRENAEQGPHVILKRHKYVQGTEEPRGPPADTVVVTALSLDEDLPLPTPEQEAQLATSPDWMVDLARIQADKLVADAASPVVVMFHEAWTSDTIVAARTNIPGGVDIYTADYEPVAFADDQPLL